MLTKNLVSPVVTDVQTLRDQVTSQCEALLRASAYLSLRKLSCEYHEGVLTIRGQVPTFYLKQLAQACIQTAVRVEEINNQVDVDWPASRQAASSLATTVFESNAPHRVIKPLSTRPERKRAC